MVRQREGPVSMRLSDKLHSHARKHTGPPACGIPVMRTPWTFSFAGFDVMFNEAARCFFNNISLPLDCEPHQDRGPLFTAAPPRRTRGAPQTSTGRDWMAGWKEGRTEQEEES